MFHGSAVRSAHHAAGGVLSEPSDAGRASQASHYAHIRAFLESRSEAIGNMDQMFAAHARSTAIPLVTGKAKHFKRIPGLEVLDWV